MKGLEPSQFPFLSFSFYHSLGTRPLEPDYNQTFFFSLEPDPWSLVYEGLGKTSLPFLVPFLFGFMMKKSGIELRGSDALEPLS